MAENSRKCIATLSVFLYTSKYLAQKLFRGIVSKSFLATVAFYFLEFFVDCVWRMALLNMNEISCQNSVRIVLAKFGNFFSNFCFSNCRWASTCIMAFSSASKSILFFSRTSSKLEKDALFPSLNFLKPLIFL